MNRETRENRLNHNQGNFGVCLVHSSELVVGQAFSSISGLVGTAVVGRLPGVRGSTVSRLTHVRVGAMQHSLLYPLLNDCFVSWLHDLWVEIRKH